MTEAEWLACEDPTQTFRWLRKSGAVNYYRLGLLFVACCELIPPAAVDGAVTETRNWTDDEHGGVALTDAEYHLVGAVKEAIRCIGSGEGQRAALIALFRDIFGNPFRPVAFAPEWRTSTAVAMAKGMCESRDFSPMPILADALQDAGCDNDDVLNHCRDEKATHVRGCWVVDLVLGKS